MPFDWVTVVAQIINFLILVWLMKRFLYQPILHVIDEREKRVAAAIADADEKDKQAKELQATFQQKNDEFDEQRAEMKKSADDEVAGERQKMLDAVRTEAEELRKQRRQQLQQEGERQNVAIKERIQQEVLTISREVLQDLAAVSLDEQILQLFLQRLRTMPASDKDEWRSRLQQEKAEPTAQFRSSWELSAQQKQALQDALKEEFALDIDINFILAAKLVGGVEFVAQGYKMTWNIADYLNSLQNGLLGVASTAENGSSGEVAEK